MQRTLQGRLGELFLLGALILVAQGIYQTSRVLERYERPVTGPPQVGALPDGNVVRVLSMGFERLVADLFWLRTVSYIGDPEVQKAGFPEAARLARLVTDVDPHFWTAYIHMNSLLTVLRREPDAAIELLDKAIAAGAEEWRIFFLQGFNHFFFRDDYRTAAHFMEEAARRGGPKYLPFLVSRLYAHAGDPDTAIAFLRARLAEAESQGAGKKLAQRLRDLVITRDLGRIDAAVKEYRRVRGAIPPDPRALVDAGLLTRVPLDPDGHRYELRDGRAWTQIERDELRVKRAEGLQ